MAIKTGGVSCVSITLIVRVDEDDRNCSLPLKLPPPSCKKSHSIITHFSRDWAEHADILSLVVFVCKCDDDRTGQGFSGYPDDDSDKVRLGLLIVEHFSGLNAHHAAVSVDGEQSGLGVLEQTARHIWSACVLTAFQPTLVKARSWYHISNRSHAQQMGR